jgi:hypothetical protein
MEVEKEVGTFPTRLSVKFNSSTSTLSSRAEATSSDMPSSSGDTPAKSSHNSNPILDFDGSVHLETNR